MRILYFYQYFSTTQGSWGTRAYEFARRWVAAGDSVTVITSVYDKSDLRPSGLVERIDVDGIDVRVINIRLSNKHGVGRRALTFAGFMAVSCWYAIRLPADIVLCSSGPLTVGIPGLAAKWLRRTPMVFELRDLFSEGLRQLGLVKSRRVLGFFERMERFFCRRANRVVALSDSMATWLRDCWGIGEVAVITNAADNELFGAAPSLVPAELGRAGEKWAVFTGTIGTANNCGLLVDAAEVLARRGVEGVRIVLIGDGRERARLEAEAARRGLENISFVDLMPKSELARWLRRASVALLILKPIPVFDTVSPNKLFDGLAAGLPAIQTTQGWIKDLIHEHECGLTISGEDAGELADAVQKLCEDEDLRLQMAANARRVAEEQFDRDLLATRMREVLLKAANT